MKKPKARTAAADLAPLTTLPEGFFYRNKSELPPNYKRPQRRPSPRKLKPLELAYWREHQIKIASLHFLNSKRFSRHGNGMPAGTDFAVIGRGTGEHRRLYYLDRMPPPTPVVCSCLPTYRDLGGCGCEGGGGGEGGEGGCGCSESGSGCGEAGGGAGGCGAGGGGAGGCGGCNCGGEAGGGGG